jgi:hypothetical protein
VLNQKNISWFIFSHDGAIVALSWTTPLSRKQFSEMVQLAYDVGQYDTLLAQKIPNLERLCSEAANVIDLHTRSVRACQDGINKMATLVNEAKSGTLQQLTELKGLGENWFFNPKAARILNHALGEGRRMLAAMRTEAKLAEDFKADLDKIIALANEQKKQP